jgi:hypothetical protein
MSKEKGHTIQCPKKKDKQYNVQRNLSSLLEYIS